MGSPRRGERWARAAIVVDGVLYGPQQFRSALNFVDAEQPRSLPYESIRVGACCVVDRNT
jgi:hypothetical protein